MECYLPPRIELVQKLITKNKVINIEAILPPLIRGMHSCLFCFTLLRKDKIKNEYQYVMQHILLSVISIPIVKLRCKYSVFEHFIMDLK